MTDVRANALKIVIEMFKAPDEIHQQLSRLIAQPVPLGLEHLWFIVIFRIPLAVTQLQPEFKVNRIVTKPGLIGLHAMMVVGDDPVPGVADKAKTKVPAPLLLAELLILFQGCTVV